MVGILYICTGRYVAFWKDFYISAQKFLLPLQEKKYFVFTDADQIYGEQDDQVVKVYQESLGWPYNTLMRFHLFSNAEGILKTCDYLFFINANTVLVNFVEDDILPEKNNDDLVTVLHPAFWNKQPDQFTYDRNRNSTAYISYGIGKSYFMGAFNGGKTTAYFQMIDTLKNNIDIDLEKGVIALWHDESHLNHYMLDKNPLILSPSYCYPEDSTIPFSPKILILDKLKSGGHQYLRGITEIPS